MTFTNVQQNGTEYSLYINANNELAVSTTPVAVKVAEGVKSFSFRFEGEGTTGIDEITENR